MKGVLRNRGFTLLEMLAVITVVAIISSIVITKTVNLGEKSRTTKLKLDVKKINNILKVNQMVRGGDCETLIASANSTADVFRILKQKPQEHEAIGMIGATGATLDHDLDANYLAGGGGAKNIEVAYWDKINLRFNLSKLNQVPEGAEGVKSFFQNKSLSSRNFGVRPQCSAKFAFASTTGWMWEDGSAGKADSAEDSLKETANAIDSNYVGESNTADMDNPPGLAPPSLFGSGGSHAGKKSTHDINKMESDGELFILNNDTKINSTSEEELNSFIVLCLKENEADCACLDSNNLDEVMTEPANINADFADIEGDEDINYYQVDPKICYKFTDHSSYIRIKFLGNLRAKTCTKYNGSYICSSNNEIHNLDKVPIKLAKPEVTMYQDETTDRSSNSLMLQRFHREKVYFTITPILLSGDDISAYEGDYIVQYKMCSGNLLDEESICQEWHDYDHVNQERIEVDVNIFKHGALVKARTIPAKSADSPVIESDVRAIIIKRVLDYPKVMNSDFTEEFLSEAYNSDSGYTMELGGGYTFNSAKFKNENYIEHGIPSFLYVQRIDQTVGETRRNNQNFDEDYQVDIIDNSGNDVIFILRAYPMLEGQPTKSGVSQEQLKAFEDSDYFYRSDELQFSFDNHANTIELNKKTDYILKEER